MFFNGVNRLLLRRRRTSPSSSVVSITEPTELFAADSGKTFSLDSLTARIDLPNRSGITEGWTITVQCTVISRYCIVQPSDVGTGAYEHDLEPCDGIFLDSLDAVAVINYNGSIYATDPNVGSGTINAYWD